MDQDKYSAEFLDIVYPEYTNERVTKTEVDFITSQIKNKLKILDVGCGTGRHSIPLARKGYDVTGLDNTQEMLNEFNKKIKDQKLKISLLYKDILTLKEYEKYYGVICFWNAFDQIADTVEKGKQFFRVVYDALSEGGKLIMEISNPDSFDPSHFELQSSIEKGDITYEVSFVLRGYDEKKRVTKANEKIFVKKDGKIIKKSDSDISLRWWTKKEIEELAKEAGFREFRYIDDLFKDYKEKIDSMVFVITK